MIIRKANAKDIEGIASVHVDTWHTAYKEFVPGEYLEKLSYEKSAKRIQKFLNESIIYVAETDDGKIVGFANGGKERKNNPVYKGEIYAIYILHEYQHQGIGKKLIAAVCKDLHAMGIDNLIIWVFDDNKIGKNFYEKIGGKPVEHGVWESETKTLTETGYGYEDISGLYRGTVL